MNDQERKDLYTFYVAGVQFHELKKCIQNVKEDDVLTINPEPTNKYDPNAIRIEFNEFMIGYVPKKFSSEVSAALEVNEDLVCIVDEVNPENKPWEQLRVSIVED